MLTPEQLDHYPDSLVNLYAQTERDIIADMARRINTYDYFIPSAEWQYRKLAEMNNVHDDILKQFAQQSGKSQDELLKLMKEAGQQSISVDDAMYNKAGLAPLPLGQSAALLAVLDAGLKKTNGLFTNLTKTTANTATKQFEDALDRAYMQITSGAFDANSAIRTAIKDLAKQGVASIQYPTGHIDHMDVAVRRATLTGVSQTALKMQEARADEMGCDLVEVTAHAGARPAHAAWQGGIYSRSGNSSQYENFEYATGYGTGAGLGGWNCKHSWFPYFEGISKPAYTQKELDEFTAKTKTYNGKKMTEYDASQKQRYIERQIRAAKREYAGMEAAGLDTVEAASQISKWQDIQKDFLQQTGLKRQGDREQIPGFGKREAGKVTQAKHGKVLSEATDKSGVKPDINKKVDDNVRKGRFKKVQFKGITSNELKLYSQLEIQQMAQQTEALTRKHLQIDSKWSGNIVFNNEGKYQKAWNCDINLDPTLSPSMILHEQLHARSISHYDMKTYAQYHKIEEATVQLTTQEISLKEGLSIVESQYDGLIDTLREVNKLSGIYSTDYDFAMGLFRVPLPGRLDWLDDKINGKILLTIEQRAEINRLLEQFY